MKVIIVFHCNMCETSPFQALYFDCVEFDLSLLDKWAI